MATNGNGKRAARGTSSPEERLARVQGTLKGLAPDVLAHPSDDVMHAYRQALREVNRLAAEFSKAS